MPATAITTKLASRINPDLVDEATPVGRFVAIDDANGNNWINVDNRMLLIIKNTTVNTLTCTFEATSTYSGIALPDEVVVIPANDLCIIGPWPNADFGGSATNTLIEVQYTGTTPAAKILILDVKKNDA